MSKMKIAMQGLRYLAINGIFAAAIYFGMFAEIYGGTNITGAENLAVFMAWVTGLLGALLMVGLWVDEHGEKAGELRETLARQEQSVVPFPVDLTFDLIVLAAFVWSGYIWLSLFYIISIVSGKAMRDIPKNLMLKKLKSQQS